MICPDCNLNYKKSIKRNICDDCNKDEVLEVQMNRLESKHIKVNNRQDEFIILPSDNYYWMKNEYSNRDSFRQI